MYNGLLNVYKEKGYTSFDVVAVLRGILKQKKVGHTGTLDPEAEGVLLVCLGAGTKLCDMLEDRNKKYMCRMLLGTATDTEDTTGKVIVTKPVNVSEEEIVDCINSFVGDIMQVPPMYSALKQNGKKLYELAREGIEVERPARPITIYNISIEEINIPYVTFTVECSKGTYIRSLCRDIGDKLECKACMDYLKRLSVSTFNIEDSLKLSDIEKLAGEGVIGEHIHSVEAAFTEYRVIRVNEEGKKYIDNGNKLRETNLYEHEAIADNERVRVYNYEGDFIALYQYYATQEEYAPVKMFISEK